MVHKPIATFGAQSDIETQKATAPTLLALLLKLMPELVMLALCGVLWLRTSDFKSSVGGPGPAMYPRVLIGLLALAMVVRIVQHLLAAKTVEIDNEDLVPEEDVESEELSSDIRWVFLAIVLAVGYVFGTIYLGWLIATFVFTIVFLVVTDKRNPLIIVLAALVLSFGMVYVFVKIVYISLPTGVGAFDVITVRLFEIMGIY